jgi:hypothetical protein
MNLSNFDAKEKRVHFEKMTAKQNNMMKNAKCYFDNCNKHSIGSHSISKNHNIKCISEDNCVMSFVPRRNADNKDLVLDRVGIGKASVFPGFCKHHDDLFNRIDISGITTIKDVLLQSYRSVCFWLHKNYVSGIMLKEIQGDVDDTFKNFIEENILEFDYDEFRYGGEYQRKKKEYLKMSKSVKVLLEKAIQHVDETIKIEPFMEIGLGEVKIYYKKVDECIPIVLNTMNTTKLGDIFQIVIPTEKKTDLIVIDALGMKTDLFEQWKVATSNMLNIIELIESWMISCEEWYIRPSIIGRMSEDRIKKLSEDIRYWQGEHGLWETYDVSVFDELRLKYLKIYKENDNLTDSFEKKENEKFFPKEREKREIREINMKRQFAELQFYGEFN